MKSHDKDSSNCLPVKKDPWNDFYTFTLRTGASEKQAVASCALGKAVL